jgi:hypothetical protein
MTPCPEFAAELRAQTEQARRDLAAAWARQDSDAADVATARLADLADLIRLHGPDVGVAALAG